MDKMWDRKSFKVVVHWSFIDEKTNDHAETLKKKKKNLHQKSL